MNYKGKMARRVHDEWWFYDQLPSIVRERLSVAVQPWSSSHVLDYYRKKKKLRGRIAALSEAIDYIDRGDRHFATKNKDWGGPTPCAVTNVEPLITRNQRSI
jgi:hypothetical protein